MPYTPLILDTFVFDEARMEVPEAFGDVGGHQSIEQHDFPGGVRTQKSYGFFPAAQKWKAKVHSGDAGDRVELLKRILATGKEVKLQFSTRAWLGRVARFSPTVRHDTLYEYDIEFWPRYDYATPYPTTPPLIDYATILDLHILSLQGLIDFGLTGNLAFEVAAAEIGGPIAFFLTQVQGALAGASGGPGSLDALGQQNVYESSLSALSACKQGQSSSNPAVSSPSADAAARIQAIQNLVTAKPSIIATVQTVNPNLLVLAAQYYGDSSKWKVIATANLLSDPQPIGSFNLLIPTLT